MQELIKEYGRGMLSAVTGIFLIGVLGFACRCIVTYIEFVADLLMGNG